MAAFENSEKKSQVVELTYTPKEEFSVLWIQVIDANTTLRMGMGLPDSKGQAQKTKQKFRKQNKLTKKTTKQQVEQRKRKTASQTNPHHDHYQTSVSSFKENLRFFFRTD